MSQDRDGNSVTNSDLSGNAGDVVQARDIAGGIHFHGPGRNAAPVPAQLPADIRGFVNRTADLQRLDTVLGQDLEHSGPASVCVIAGTAGVGKTSLAVRWAHRNRNRFPDGQLYVNLRGYDPGEPVTATQALERFLTAFGVPAAAVPAEVEDRSALFRSLLASRRVLIVLDNAATVGQVRAVLPGAGRCLVLVTSRSRLSGLITRDGAHRITLEVFDEPEAVELLKVTVADYRSGDDDTEIVELARLCARLPLALRIAAERAAARPRMPMGELIDNLRDESNLWDALSAEDDDEADAVRTVFAWSYRALPTEAATMFRLLGLHPGPDFSLGAAAVLADVPVSEARRRLDVLVGAHLLGQIGFDRYQFHDLLRAYAGDQVRHQDTDKQRIDALRRLLWWYLHTAAACVESLALADPSVRPVPLVQSAGEIQPQSFADSAAASDWFTAERNNLVSAVSAAVGAGFDDLAWQIPAVLRNIYSALDLFDDWFATTRVGLDAAVRNVDSHGQAFLHESLAMANRQSYRLDEAAAAGEAALHIHLLNRDRHGEANAHLLLGVACVESHRIPDAHRHFAQAEALCREHEFDALLAMVLADTAWASIEAGDHADAADYCAESLSLARAAGSPRLEWEAHIHMARVATAQGLYERATLDAEHAIEIARATGDLSSEANALCYYAPIQRMMGNAQGALASCHRSAQISRQQGRRQREGMALDETGLSYASLDWPEEAVAFHEQALSIFREIRSAWRQAVTLDHLAEAMLQNDGNMDRAVLLRQEALEFLEDFNDTAARALRASIRSAL